MSLDFKTQWQIARYRLNFKVLTPIRLPSYAGSTLRGCFGRALRRVACMTREKDCRQCPLYKDCAYTNVFESPAPEVHELQKFSQIPNAYVIEPPAYGERIYEVGEILSFHIVLFGTANARLSLIIYSLQKAFAYDVGHGKASLESVVLETENDNELIYTTEHKSILPHSACVDFKEFDFDLNNVKLHFYTPLRLKKEGKLLEPNEITAETFLMSLLRRVSLISQFHCNKKIDEDYHSLRIASQLVDFEQHLSWQKFNRYSSRQHTTMDFSGLVGEIILRNLNPRFVPYLLIGQWTHVGKNASFGLGKYKFM